MLDQFYHHREIFCEVKICPDRFSLLQQHSLWHYIFSITQFGAPNGLCSLITESKHIKEVKKTYCCLSRSKPLGQMLITNQHINKITATCVDFNACGMLRLSGTFCSTWAEGLRPRHFALWMRSFCFRYSVRALGLWQYGWYMVTRVWEISQVYEVFRGVCRFCATNTRLTQELRLRVWVW